MHALKITRALHCKIIWKNNSWVLCIRLRYSPELIYWKKEVSNCFLKNNKHSTLEEEENHYEKLILGNT